MIRVTVMNSVRVRVRGMVRLMTRVNPCGYLSGFVASVAGARYMYYVLSLAN